MNTISALVSPPYSLVLLLDPTMGIVPQTMAGGLIAATDSCVAVGCKAVDDGGTKITLGPEDAVDPGYEPVFEGGIETPSRILEVQSIVGTTILRTEVQDPQTRVAIWVNDPKEPDEITVGITD